MQTKVFCTRFPLMMEAAVVAGLAVPALAGATSAAPFSQCPAADHDTSCGVLITVNPDGSTSVQTDTTQAAMDGTDGALVGIVNNSNSVASSYAPGRTSPPVSRLPTRRCPSTRPPAPARLR